MNDEVKMNCVPELRFPTFEKSDNWRDVKLIDVTDKNKKWSFTGGPFGSNLKSSDYVKEKDGVRIIQLQNIGDGEFKNDYKIYTSKEKADELLSCNIYPGDIIMSKMGDPVGRACLIPDFHKRYVMSSDGIRIAVDEDKYDKYFIYLVINFKIFRSKVENSSTGSTRKRIGLIDLKKLTLSIPIDKDEQQKIANCLSSLDNVITAETEKLDHLKDHKKGLLQQLFPANGETKPQFRFPEFENDGDWEEKHLKKVFSIFQGYSFSSKDSVVEGTRWLKIADVGIQNMKHNNPSFLPDDYINIYEKFLIKKGDYVLALTRPILNGKLKISLVDDLLHNSLLNQRVGKLVSDENLTLIYYLLQTNYLIKEIEKSIAGSEPPNLSMKQIENIEISLPPNPKEQQKIANCLSSADDVIEAQTIKIKALKKHKKGLMQQLFP